jgi:short-subunit dehydrogenase
MYIAGSTVLVTGANGGVGEALARGLAAKGAKLVLSGRRADALEALATELGARPIVADLADPAQVERLAAEAGAVDILVANAALPSSGRLLDYSVEQIDRSLAVNLRAPIALCRLLAPAMVTAGRGHLVLVGSLSGKVASPETTLYTAAKFGLRGFVHGLRQDLHGTGVGVSIVQPGFIRDAGMFAKSGAKLPPGLGTVSPAQVVAGIVRVIERDEAEIDVAPLGLRLGSTVGGIFPAFAARLQRRLGADATARQLVDGQRHQR